MVEQSMMDAVVLNGPFTINIERRPKPAILSPTDVIIKVSLSGICGSELHPYRGHQNTTTGHVMGHEFTGVIEEAGQEVQLFKPGEHVLCTFSTSCMQCWFCQHGYTNRCYCSLALGTQQLDGGQAQYVRVPYADGTLKHAPDGVEDEIMILMSDIFPTGYYGAMRAITAFQSDSVSNGLKKSNDVMPTAPSWTPWVGSGEPQHLSDAVFVCLGCGPVGLCAILTAVVKGVGKIYAVDSVLDRLEAATKMGAIPIQLGKDDAKQIIIAATGGRGADAVIEVVGNKPALRSAFDLLRPCGTLSSIGFHQGDLPFTALECYQKNLNINLGRAPVQGVFEEALEVLVANKEKFSDFITHRLPLSEAAHGYELFEKQQARKVVLRA